MPDTRTHRGSHPQDAKLFAPETIVDLSSAVHDFSLLLTKGYAEKSSLKLVGDRFSLTQRQRLAVMRNSCSDQQLRIRRKKQIDIKDLAGKNIAIDGYNLLITIESAISGAIIFKGRDGCDKDLASIRGTYRKVTETMPAIILIGEFLEEAKVQNSFWLLDSPVSNSGRLKTRIAEIARKNNFKWDIQLVTNPDAELIKSDLTVVSSDGIIINRCKSWLNLAAEIINTKLPDIKPFDLSCPPPRIN